MPKLSDSLPAPARWEIAVQTLPPAQVARAFANNIGQVYDRSEFDDLARRVRALYDREAPERAAAFQSRLDRRLYDRYHAPVAWDVASPPAA
jgi:hypothetical protein